MNYFVYIISSSERKALHTGFCKDIVLAMSYYAKIPSISWPPVKMNVLVYLEEQSSEVLSRARIAEIKKLNRAEMDDMISSVNPNWQGIDINDGVFK